MKIILLIQLLISVISSKTLFEFIKSNHTNNWAVLVDTSRFWFNYRHVANVLSIYQSVKRLGIPDSHIILMIADDMACNPRNPYPSTVFNNANRFVNVYDNDVEVDYRGFEVTVENFIRILINRLPYHTPNSKRLLSDDKSNILIYLTGHGGDGFLKFQDSEELTSHEFADAIEQMWLKQRYNEIFFMIDTCQAATMFQEIYSPNVLSIASSSFGEDSLSHHLDYTIGVYIIDRFTYYALEFLQNLIRMDTKTIAEFFRICPKHQCISTVANRTDLFKRNIRETKVTDFFGSRKPLTISKRTKYRENDLFQSNDKVMIYLDDNIINNNDLEIVQQQYKYVDQFPLF